MEAKRQELMGTMVGDAGDAKRPDSHGPERGSHQGGGGRGVWMRMGEGWSQELGWSGSGVGLGPQGRGEASRVNLNPSFPALVGEYWAIN